MSLVKVDNLRVYFDATDRLGFTKKLKAVDGISFEVGEGECVGLVGESGCGKSTVGNAIIGLVPVTEGTISFEGQFIVTLRGDAMMQFRQKTQMVFQDPFGSLNPRMSIGSAIAEVIHVHKLTKSRAETDARVAEILKAVGLEPEYAGRYPHEFSGGQRQRIGIARALAVNPSFIIADEPVSALDVSVQVQILNLLKDLQERMNLSYLFIAHDLAVVRYMCSRILVMYLGKIVESSPADELFKNPAHPYTEALLSAIPEVEKGLRAKREGTPRIVLKGDIPSATELIPGCPFHTRCHKAKEICRQAVPSKKMVSKEHISVCHFS